MSASDLDEIMARLDADPSLLPTKDTDTLIAYYRAHRAQVDAGVKVKKEAGPKKEINLAKLLPQVAAKATSDFKRRV